MIACLFWVVTACTSTQRTATRPETTPTPGIDLAIGNEAPTRAEVGNSYQIAGKWYQPEHDPNYDRQGIASWYGRQFHGRRTANGEIFDRGALTAAHPTLPLPSYVRVTNNANDRSIVVRVNDRGPFSRTRLIDVSERTADLLGFKGAGVASVRVQYVGRATTDGNDDQFLLASFRGPQGINESPRVILAAASQSDRASQSRAARPKPVQVAALANPPLRSAPASDPVAFTVATKSSTGAAATDAVGVLSARQETDARISMAFDLISAAAE